MKLPEVHLKLILSFVFGLTLSLFLTFYISTETRNILLIVMVWLLLILTVLYKDKVEPKR